MKIFHEQNEAVRMDIDIDDNFSDEPTDENAVDLDDDNSDRASTLSDKKIQEQAKKNLIARKRIDELKEQQHLKSLLDDADDW